MDHGDFPTSQVEVKSIDATELKDRIDDGEDIAVLDVRVPDEYDQWAIDGPTVDVRNVPYFEFIDEVDEGLIDLPERSDSLVVVCAKGGASEYVAGRLSAELGVNAMNLADGMNGWAAIYDRHKISRYEGPGAVYQYQRPSSGCLGYLVVSNGEAAVIDPLRAFTDRYVADANELGVDIKFALDTHVHADHVSGVRALAEQGADGVIPRASAERGVTYADEMTLVDDGDVLPVGDARIEVIHTPGHTTDMTTYLIGDSLLATGDGLFVESVARPDLEAGDDGAADAARQLHESLETRVLTFPEDTIIGGGHVSEAAEPAGDGTYTATLGQLRQEMEALSMEQDSFVELVLSDMPPRPANHEEIVEANLGRREVGDEEAFTLELGPNNCAASRDALASD